MNFLFSVWLERFFVVHLTFEECATFWSYFIFFNLLDGGTESQ